MRREEQTRRPEVLEKTADRRVKTTEVAMKRARVSNTDRERREARSRVAWEGEERETRNGGTAEKVEAP